MYNNYIVIEGLEGSGKTTAIDVVANILRNFGIKNIICTREPGSTLISEKIRDLILESKLINNERINNITEMLMFYAARVQLVETIIKPALSAGSWVISDRHDLSTQAYQGGGYGISKNILKKIRNSILGNFYPALTLYLDVSPEIGLSRVRFRGKLNRIEYQSMEFFSRTRDRYIELANKDNSIHIIDANQKLEDVKCAITNTVVNWFKRR